jgi:hypothetical protein
MTIDTISGGNVEAYVPSSTEISMRVAQYASDLQSCIGLATGIVDTEIVPSSFWPAPAVTLGDEVKILKSWEWDPRRKHPKESAEDYASRRRTATATTAGVIHVGATLGHVSYFQSISGIYFVGGRPALMSEEMRAQVIGAGHYIRPVKRTAECAVVACRRRGETCEPREYEFTIDDAERAGYVPGRGENSGTDKWGKPKKGGNPKYLTDPKTMLVARATTIACRLEFPDVIRGMVAAELADDDRTPATAVEVVAVETTPRVSAGDVLAITGPTQTEDVDAAAAAMADVLRPEDVPGLDTTTWRAINAKFAELRVQGPGQTASRLAVIGHIVGRQVSRGSELSEPEGRLVLDTLDGSGREVVEGVLRPSAEDDADPVPVDDGEPAGWEMDGAETAGEGR